MFEVVATDGWVRDDGRGLGSGAGVGCGRSAAFWARVGIQTAQVRVVDEGSGFGCFIDEERLVGKNLELSKRRDVYGEHPKSVFVVHPRGTTQPSN